MTGDRHAAAEIAEMHGSAALPRKSGEMVFHDDWERRAFAIAVSLAERGLYDWSKFQQQLIRAISEAEKDDPQNPGRGYYESWLVAVEALLEEEPLLAETGAQADVTHGLKSE